MSIGLDTPSRLKMSRHLSETQLLALARTYDTASSPIWIEDMSGACVYQNVCAETGDWPSEAPLACFEVFDHLGRVVARLGTVHN
ncbi:MAG: hypothetical protein KA354_22035 [Phycisphaerae bacterium]|nr:hypothetical protein [Phycisphaerae bacterium]